MGLALEVLLDVTVSKWLAPQYLVCSDSVALCAAAVAAGNLCWLSIGVASSRPAFVASPVLGGANICPSADFLEIFFESCGRWRKAKRSSKKVAVLCAAARNFGEIGAENSVILVISQHIRPVARE